MKGERADWFAEAAEFTPLVAVETKRGTYLVRTHDRQTGGLLFARRIRPEFAVVGTVIRLLQEIHGKGWVNDRTFVDVGANIGTSVIPALLGGFAQAVAIEPAPENVQTLRLNLLLNCLADRVTVVPMAATDEVRPLGLRLEDLSSGKHTIGRLKKKRPGVEVAGTTLDALVEESVIDPAAVGVLWVDVQGHEGHVLAGATRFVGTTPVVIEWAKKADTASRLDGVEMLSAYSHFADLRAEVVEMRPTADLRRFCDEHEPGVTDLLAVNLP